MFKHVMEVEIRKLHNVKLPPCSDMNDKIISAYYYSCLGEFHEGSIVFTCELNDRILWFQ